MCLNGRVSKLDIQGAHVIGTLYDFPFSTLPFLEYVDLSMNNLSGTIPPEIGNLTNLVYLDRISTLFKTIDLSSNKFEGHIPGSLGDLIALQVLNLSHNRLQGNIPSSLESLSSVESLDLSFNQLSGEIPQQLVGLRFLSLLNLSHNHLQGCIPQGHQFDTFGNNSYEGNDGLQGFPVSKGCGSNWTPKTSNSDYESDGKESNSEFVNDFWKAALMGYVLEYLLYIS
ncbi:hypothetical protein MTR67_050828 [Solanum verrucosum]|uniref:Uncharacterized protein n=1 Tax=Solanum verrucosum TaxID=315347 RepID=A0AAF0V267_SOLVR|nr:hypothetical protein MTR67_050828 [Solanum verrucosum]